MNPKELVQAEWPKAERQRDCGRRISGERRGGIDEEFWGTATDIGFPNLFTGVEEEKEKVNMMMMMRGWRIILKLADYITLLDCKHKTFNL
jgi:hypothetical protein